MKVELKGWRWCPVLYIGALSWAPAFFLPYDLMAAMERFALTEEQAGWLTSAQLLMLALTAMLCSRRILALDKRQTCLLACMIGVLVNIGAASTDSFALFVLCKMLYGVAAGILSASGYSLAPVFHRPERVFARIGMTISVVFGIVIFIVPTLDTYIGIIGMDVMHMLLMLLGIFLARGMPAARMVLERPTQVQPRQALPIGVKLLLVSLFGLFASQTATIGFASVSGESLTIDHEVMALVFMLSAFAQLPAAMLVEWLGNRKGYFLPLYSGLLLLIVIAIGMYCLHEVWLFFVCLTLVNAGAMLVNPYLITLIAMLDDSGRSTAIAGSITNYGLALGPALAGFAFAMADLFAVGLLSVALLLISLYCALSLRHKKLILSSVLQAA